MKTASVAAERLRRAVEDLGIPHEALKPPGVVTVSLGLAELSPKGRKSVETLLEEADAALYLAKEEGKNRVVYYSKGC